MDSIHDGCHGYLCSGSVRVLDYVTLHNKSLGRQWPLLEDGMPVEQDLCNCWWEPSFIQYKFGVENQLDCSSNTALYCADFFYKYSDDCPLGNCNQVKRAGLMVERCAVDSFRSDAMNMNSWILFLATVSNECVCP